MITKQVRKWLQDKQKVEEKGKNVHTSLISIPDQNQAPSRQNASRNDPQVTTF